MARSLLRNGTLLYFKVPRASVADPAKRATQSHPHVCRPATVWPCATDTASFAVPAKPAASAAPATTHQQVLQHSGLRSWRRTSHAASPMLQTCKPACCQSATSVSKATSSSISREASEKRNRTASQQHTLIRYRDECSRACSVLCAVFVASVLAILSLPRGDAQIQEAEGFSFS